MNARRLKISICREEYFEITGSLTDAIILNQMLYWSERVSDFDAFIEDELKRIENEDYPVSPKKNGWFYKTAEELSDETMLCLSKSNMREHIKKLIDMKFIDERINPKLKWDKTKQYRVNLVEIIKALYRKGYVLSNYKVDFPFSFSLDRSSPNETPSSETELVSPDSNLRSSKTEQQYQRLLTETTTDNNQSKYNAHARGEVTDDEYGNPVPDQDWLRVQKCYELNLRSQFPQGVREDDLWNLYTDLGADVMCFGIEQTARAAGDSNGAFAYLNTLLTNWRKQNVKTLEQAKLQHAKHQRNSKSGRTASQAVPTPDRNVKEYY